MARFFVNRPIVAMVIAIVMLILGAVALRGLPVAQYPEIVPPMIQVSTTFVGASATDVEASVATPLEQDVNGVEDMIYMKSVNANDGTMLLQVAFEVGTNLDMANVLTQNRVTQATPKLPNSVKQYGVSVKKSLNFPLLLVSLESPEGTYDNNFLSNYAAINVNDSLKRISGVGDVVLFGGSDYAMRVWLNPDRLAGLGLTVPDVLNAINEQNVISPAGQIGGPPTPPGTDFTYTVQTQGRLMTAEEFGRIVLRTDASGRQVRIEDVARVELGTVLYNSQGRVDGKPAAVVAVYQLPGSNAIQVADQVFATMDELATRFPQGLIHRITLDTTQSVREGLKEIVVTLFEAMALVILVVFVFLQNWRATLIPLIAIPVSLVATFAVFPLVGFSVNTLSLLGLVLAIGTVVDDAIVVVEAVMYHVERGLSPKEATLKAMQEVSAPVVATTLVMVAVFLPVAFMGGITGRLYQQFAITIAISVVFSSINALTLSPALAAMVLKPQGEGRKSLLAPFYRVFNRVLDGATTGYLGIAGFLIRRVVRSMLILVGLVVLIFLLLQRIPGGFIPEEDQGYLLVAAQLPDAASLERTMPVCQKVEEIIAGVEGVETVSTIVGYSLLSQSYSTSMGFFFISLKDWSERTGEGQQVAQILGTLNRRFAAQVPEAVVFAFGPPAIPGLGTGAGFTMMLQDRAGNTPGYLAEQTQKFVQAAMARPEVGRIGTPYRSDVPQIFFDIDRDKVLKLGVSIQDVNRTLGALLGGSYVNDFNRFGRVYKVYAMADADYRRSVGDLGLFYVRSSGGDMVPLSTLVTTSPVSGPEYTNRFNLYRAAELSGVPAPGFSSGQALAALEEVAAEVLPQDMGYDWANMSYQEKKAAGTGAVVFAFALLFVFLILAAQYESWSMPLSILLGIPFAVFGAFGGLWLARQFSPSYVNNVFAQIGLVMLIGLAAKNAILIVEFAREKMDKEGLPPVDAALEAAKLRFRPILMTAFSFILGVLPLLVASGAGAEARKVMGMAVFSGMLMATVFGVCLVPVLFVLVERVFGRRKTAAPATDAVPASEGGKA
jgi:HAE1 family hydrophobic/amphiphilic exporter-1